MCIHSKYELVGKNDTKGYSNANLDFSLKRKRLAYDNYIAMLSNKSYTFFRWAFTRRLKANTSYLSEKQLAGRLFHWFAVRTKNPDDRQTVWLWGTSTEDCRELAWRECSSIHLFIVSTMCTISVPLYMYDWWCYRYTGLCPHLVRYIL